VEFEEHVDFHSSKSSGNVNSLITLLGVLRQKGGKQALENSIVVNPLKSRMRMAQGWGVRPKNF
jgi:hypothetical protein